ncbi:hypothetical protein ACP70R_021189 [Stipagrostis hirtigluma subsp. patula]
MFLVNSRIEEMDPLNQSYPQQEPEDELAYMYHQEEQPRMFAEPLPEQQLHQHYTSAPLMAPPNPFHPSRSCSTSSYPNFGGSALPNMPLGAAAVKKEPSSSSPNILSFSGQPPSRLSFSGGDWPDGLEGAPQAPERRSRAHWNTAEHVVAERKRREKMQQQFVALATIVPDLTKTDKVSVLGSTIKYVKQLEEKVKTLEHQSARRTSECTITDGSGPRGSASGAGSGFSPAIKASIHGDTVLLKIWCEQRRGLLVMVIAELENQGLSIINTNVLPVTDSCLNITITAKIGEGFSTTAELVENLTTALTGFT